jgi:D-serine dehydratase
MTTADDIIDSTEKGLPFGAAIRPAEVRSAGWNVLRDDLHLPLLVLKEAELSHNIAAMAAWCRQHDYLLSPHGKTTMCPRIFDRQLHAGAWGITLAHPSQLLVAANHGVKRVLLANQVTGRANVHSLALALAADPEFECWCLVDSVEGVQQLAGHLRDARLNRPLPVLLEWGRAGWRTGVRSLAQGMEVVRAVGSTAGTLELAGVEAFEGLAHGEDAATEVALVNEFLAGVRDLARHLDNPGDWIFSIGGSAFLDLVHRWLRDLPGSWRKVLRSGCYVTHDHGFYRDTQEAAQLRHHEGSPVFRPALELWSYVQSIPEPGHALLTFGKRDCPHDAGMPVPLNVPRATITGLND